MVNISKDAKESLKIFGGVKEETIMNILRKQNASVVKELFDFTGASCFDNLVHRLSQKIYSPEISSIMGSILSRLSNAVHGTDKDLYSQQELDVFAFYFLIDDYMVNPDNVTDELIVDKFLDFWFYTDRTCRRCTQCGNLMRDGYCVDGGSAYYCSSICLHQNYSDEEWEQECENNDQSYYTEWY